MHALKNHLSLQPLHMQDAFVAQQAGPETVDHGIHELAKPRTVKRMLRAEDKARHVIMVVKNRLRRSTRE